MTLALPKIRGYLFASKAKRISLASSASILFEKELISEGVWWHPVHGWEMDLDGKFLGKLVKAFSAMTTNGIDIPVPRGHDFGVEANTGYTRKLWTAKNPKGGLSLWGLLEITEPEVAEKMDRGTIRRVSVAIDHDAMDGKKNSYGPAIIHVALTSYPVAHEQNDEFIRVEADEVMAASYAADYDGLEAMFAGREGQEKVYCLSRQVSLFAETEDLPSLTEVIEQMRERRAPWVDEWDAWDALSFVIWKVKDLNLTGAELRSAVEKVVDEFGEWMSDALERQAIIRLKQGVFSALDRDLTPKLLREFAGLPSEVRKLSSEPEEESEMDLQKILKDKGFVALCDRLAIERPAEPTEAWVLSVYSKAQEGLAAADVARTSAEEELVAARAELDSRPMVTATLESEDPPVVDLAQLEKDAAKNPQLKFLLDKHRESERVMKEQGEELARVTRDRRLSAVVSADKEAEEACAAGKLTEEGKKAFSRLLRVQATKVLGLSKEGEPGFEDVDVPATARALLSSLPEGASVPMDERTIRVHGNVVQKATVLSNPKDKPDLTDDEISKLARENAALVGMDVAD